MNHPPEAACLFSPEGIAIVEAAGIAAILPNVLEEQDELDEPEDIGPIADQLVCPLANTANPNDPLSCHLRLGTLISYTASFAGDTNRYHEVARTVLEEVPLICHLRMPLLGRDQQS
jgi:hypothetical protein